MGGNRPIMKVDKLLKTIIVTILLTWLSLFVIVPSLLLILLSLSKSSNLFAFPFFLTFQHYLESLNSINLSIFLRSVRLAFLVTLICFLLAYPLAYILARENNPIKKMILVFLLILPAWTSSLIRIYSMTTIISANGPVMNLLLRLHLIKRPIQLLFTNFAVIWGLCYDLFPFMFFPIFSFLDRFDWKLLDAAADLGASKFTTLRRIVLPLSLPSILAGIILVLLPAMTLFYVPDILGGAKTMLLGNLIRNHFLLQLQWAQGAVLAVFLILFSSLLIGIYLHYSKKDQKEILL